MGKRKEPIIVINGITLTNGQAMAVRCAVTSFIADMGGKGLGDDEQGRKTTEAYLERLNEVLSAMLKY